MATVVVVIIREHDTVEHICDASHMSPYVSDIIGQSVTFVGAWGDVSMLGGLQPDLSRPVIEPSRLPNGCDPNLRPPLVVTKLDESFEPVDFTLQDYAALLLR